MSDTASFEHGGNVYSVMRKSGTPISQLLDFSANINPLGLSSNVKKAILQSVDEVIHYPDAEASALKTAISDYYKVPWQWLTAGNGAVEMLYVVCNILRPNKVLITAPAFNEYERAARSVQAQIQYALLSAENGFAIDIDNLIDQLAGVGIVFLGNPNNPTGTLLLQVEIEKLLHAALKQGTYVVVDESFLDFLPDDSKYTCRELLSRYENLVIIHSLTKFYAIPGLRLGFALANPMLTRLMDESKDPWNVNSLAQSAGVAALNDGEYQRHSRETVNKAKQQFYSQLSEINGIKPFVPAVNFILCDIAKTGFKAPEICDKLMEKGVLVRDCSNYPGLSNQYIRLAVKMPEDNAKLTKILTELLENEDD